MVLLTARDLPWLKIIGVVLTILGIVGVGVALELASPRPKIIDSNGREIHCP